MSGLLTAPLDTVIESQSQYQLARLRVSLNGMLLLVTLPIPPILAYVLGTPSTTPLHKRGAGYRGKENPYRVWGFP